MKLEIKYKKPFTMKMLQAFQNEDAPPLTELIETINGKTLDDCSGEEQLRAGIEVMRFFQEGMGDLLNSSSKTMNGSGRN